MATALVGAPAIALLPRGRQGAATLSPRPSPQPGLQSPVPSAQSPVAVTMRITEGKVIAAAPDGIS